MKMTEVLAGSLIWLEEYLTSMHLVSRSMREACPFFDKHRTGENKRSYSKQRNYCVSLLRKTKK